MGSVGTMVTWQEPRTEDLSGRVTVLVQTHAPGSYFPVGTTSVSYVYTDNSNNIASCVFSVIGSSGEIWMIFHSVLPFPFALLI